MHCRKICAVNVDDAIAENIVCNCIARIRSRDLVWEGLKRSGRHAETLIRKNARMDVVRHLKDLET